MSYSIRKAERGDCPAILHLIRALAEYEKALDQVVCTVQDLERDGFGDKPFFECLLLEEQGQAVGMALYFYNWSTWTGRPTFYLEDLLVLPESRGKGYGMALLKACAKIAVDQNCKRFEWAVLDWNMPAREFYHKIGAYHKVEWLPYRLEGQPLQKLGR